MNYETAGRKLGMAKSFEAVCTEERRLSILRLLRDTEGYLTNETVLKEQLHAIGYALSTDRLRTDSAWLMEQGLIVIDQADEGWVIQLLIRGLDVSNGVALSPGIARPKPHLDR